QSVSAVAASTRQKKPSGRERHEAESNRLSPGVTSPPSASSRMQSRPAFCALEFRLPCAEVISGNFALHRLLVGFNAFSFVREYDTPVSKRNGSTEMVAVVRVLGLGYSPPIVFGRICK